jgi:hypothetical protein
MNLLTTLLPAYCSTSINCQRTASQPVQSDSAACSAQLQPDSRQPHNSAPPSLREQDRPSQPPDRTHSPTHIITASTASIVATLWLTIPLLLPEKSQLAVTH